MASSAQTLDRGVRCSSDEVWYHGYYVSWTQQRGIGAPTMSQPTQPKDTGQEAHNRGGLEDNYISNLINMASRDRVRVKYNGN
jgi:hypothetical protein